MCKEKKHEDNCYCLLLKRHYGQRPFKCDILECSFRRHGFPTKSLRDKHVRHHDRPWKCAVQSCEYAEGGFLSRRMRDEHLDSSHQEAKSQKANLLPSNLDVDELQPLFFDLIRLDKVEEVESIRHHFTKLNVSVQAELLDLVASSGSASMAQVMYNEKRRCIGVTENLRWLTSSIKGMNFETCRYLISRTSDYQHIYSRTGENILIALVNSGSQEMFQECEKLFINVSLNGANTGILFVQIPVIKATAGYPHGEKVLLSIWAALERNICIGFTSQNLGDALKNVAKTTCSLVLTRALLQYGADIDYKRTPQGLSPLHYAARHHSSQAAELMKFLLYQGANPEPAPGNSKLKISEEKGAKEIAAWLGKSWDELIREIKLDRERGFCPPEYTLD